jgi:phage head maturation protease
MNIPQHLLNVEGFRQVEVKAESVEKLKSERAIIHYISTPDIDRTRDIMNPKGMKDEDFNKAPSVWYNHNYKYDPNALPIARSLWRKKKEDGILTKTEFASTEFADDVYLLHDGGFINTWSIGFRPSYDKNGNIKDGSIRYDEGKNITTWDEWYLLEYSSAPLPANIEALDVVKELQTLNFKSEITKNMVNESAFKIEVTKALESFRPELDKIKSLQSQLDDLLKSFDGVLGDLEKAENQILELQNEINNTKQPIHKSLEVLDGKQLLENIRLNIIGDTTSGKTK